MEGSRASGQTKTWPQVLTLLPTKLLESWVFLGLFPHAKQGDCSSSGACDDPVQENNKYKRALNKLQVLCKHKLLRCGSRLKIWRGKELLS